MSFKSDAQRKLVMAILSKDLPRRLAKVARVSQRETRGLRLFKYSPETMSAHAAWMIDGPAGSKARKVFLWEEERGKDSGEYAGHYNKGTKAIWVKREREEVDWHHPSTRRMVVNATKRTLKHEIGHHVWDQLPRDAQETLRQDNDFYRKSFNIRHGESKYYHDAGDTEAFARLYTDVRGVRLSEKRKKIPYYQHNRKLLAAALRALRRG